MSKTKVLMQGFGPWLNSFVDNALIGQLVVRCSVLGEAKTSGLL